MKKITIISALMLAIVASVDAKPKTAYGKATKTGKKLNCPSAQATCFTIYDNNTIDIFYESGVSHEDVVGILHTPDETPVTFEDLPEVMQPGEYTILLEDEGDGTENPAN